MHLAKTTDAKRGVVGSRPTILKLTCAALVALASLGAAPAASAQEVTATPPATDVVICFLEPAKLKDEEVAAFLADPQSLLKQFPVGNLGMSVAVRALAGSSSETLDPLLGLIENANAAQTAAIGAGLARAARACAGSYPEYASLIQDKVAAIDNADLLTAFAAASGEVQTAALGGGAAGGAGAIGNGGQAGGGTAGGGSDNGTPTTSGVFSISNAAQFVSHSVSPSSQ